MKKSSRTVQFLFSVVLFSCLLLFSGFLKAAPPPPMIYSEWAQASRAHLKQQFEHADETDPTLRTLVYPSGCINASLHVYLDPHPTAAPDDFDFDIQAIDPDGCPWVLLGEKFPLQNLVHYKFLIKDRDKKPTAYLDFEVNKASSSVILYFMHLTAYTTFRCEGRSVFQGVQDETEELFSTLYSSDFLEFHANSFTTIFGGINTKELLFDLTEYFTFGGSQKAKGAISVPFRGKVYTPEIVFDVPNGSYLITKKATLFTRQITFAFGTLHIDELVTIPFSMYMENPAIPEGEDRAIEFVRLYAANLHVSGTWKAFCKKIEVRTGHGYIKINDVDEKGVRYQHVHNYPFSPHPSLRVDTLITSVSKITITDDNAQNAVGGQVCFQGEFGALTARFDALYSGLRAAAQSAVQQNGGQIPWENVYVVDQTRTDTNQANSGGSGDPFAAMGFGSFANPRQFQASSSLGAAHSFAQSTPQGSRGFQPMNMGQFAEALQGMLHMVMNYRPDDSAWRGQRLRPQANLFNLQSVANSVPTRFHASFLPPPKKPEESVALQNRALAQIRSFFRVPSEEVRPFMGAALTFAPLSVPKPRDVFLGELLTASPIPPYLRQAILGQGPAAAAPAAASACISAPIMQTWSAYMRVSGERLQSFIERTQTKARIQSEREEERQRQSFLEREKEPSAVSAASVQLPTPGLSLVPSATTAAASPKVASGVKSLFADPGAEADDFLKRLQAEEEVFFKGLMTTPSSKDQKRPGATPSTQARAAAVTTSFRQQWQAHFARETATLDRFIETRNARISAQKIEGGAAVKRSATISKDETLLPPRPHSAFGREIERYLREGTGTSATGEEIESYFQALGEPTEYEEVTTAKAAETRHIEAQEKRIQAELAHEKETGLGRLGTAFNLMHSADAEVDTSIAHFFLESDQKALEKRAAHLIPALEEIDRRIQERKASFEQMPSEEREDYFALLQSRDDLEWIARIMYPANILQATESLITVGTLVSPLGRGVAEGPRQVMKFLSSASRSVRKAERNLMRMSQYMKAQTGKTSLAEGTSGKTKDVFSQFEKVIQETKVQVIQGAERKRVVDAWGLEMGSSTLEKSFSRVRKINNRMPINAEYANKTYPLEKLPPELRAKYPHSVPFTGTGHPDFSRYAIKKVEFKFSGNSAKDIRLANKLSGYKSTPDGFLWHHHQDGKTMQLVPFDIHDAIKHTGGGAIARVKK